MGLGYGSWSWRSVAKISLGSLVRAFKVRLGAGYWDVYDNRFWL